MPEESVLSQVKPNQINAAAIPMLSEQRHLYNLAELVTNAAFVHGEEFYEKWKHIYSSTLSDYAPYLAGNLAFPMYCRLYAYCMAEYGNNCVLSTFTLNNTLRSLLSQIDNDISRLIRQKREQ